MGLYIHLSINFRGITEKAWETAWHESLEILKKFPLPLFRYDVETKNGKDRNVYSRNLIIDAETKEECWYLDGDLLSRQYAETFDLYRHLEAYTKKSGQQGCYDDSVFKTDTPEYWSSSNGMELWDSKTQGYPFHLAVLAVGIMLENRFPDHCYLHGDIQDKQVEVMLKWLETTFDKKYSTPICFDACRLFKQLHLVYDSDRQAAIERFAKLYEGEDADLLKAMVSVIGEKEALAYWTKELNRYGSLNQWGAQEIVRAVLEATEDIQTLLSFVGNANLTRSSAEQNFDVSEVLKLLCSDFIFIPPAQREYARVLTQRSEDLQTIDDVINRVFMQMAGMPYVSPLYVPADELLEIFVLHRPEQAEEYRHIIEESQEKLSNWIKKLEETVRLFEESLEDSADESDDLESEVSLIESYPLHEQYIVRQAIQQQDDFETYEKQLPELVAALEVLIEGHSAFYSNKTVNGYLRGIYEYSFEAGWGLSEEGWEKLDRLSDVALLQKLFALATVDNHETTFWRWRKHVFETAWHLI